MNFNSLWLAGALSAAVLATAAFAQSSGDGCQAEALQDPPRTVLTCPNGVSIVAEDGTIFELQDRSSAAGPEAVRLDGKALLLEAPAGAVEGGFEVITPQAIAAVRGTKWAVDVADGKTSVFVVTGRVAVSREADCAGRRARTGRRRRRGGRNGAADCPQVGRCPRGGAACPLRRIGPAWAVGGCRRSSRLSWQASGAPASLFRICAATRGSSIASRRLWPTCAHSSAASASRPPTC